MSDMPPSRLVGESGVELVLELGPIFGREGRKDLLVCEGLLDFKLDNETSDKALAEVEDRDRRVSVDTDSACACASAATSLISRFSINMMKVKDTLCTGVVEIASITVSCRVSGVIAGLPFSYA